MDHIKYILPAERYISVLPDCEQFGRKTNLRQNPDKIPNLQWTLTNQLNTTQIGQSQVSPDSQTNLLDVFEEVTINSIYVIVCSYAKSNIDYNTYSTTSEGSP